jgi:hypothetical protein
VAEIEARKEGKRAKALAGLRKVESEVKERNEKTKKDAAEVKSAVDFLTASVEAQELVEKLNAPKKRKVKQVVKSVAI